MKTRETEPIAFPDDAELAALRAWYAGLGARAAVARYLGDRKPQSAHGVLGRIRRALVSYAASRHRADLAEIFGERSAAYARVNRRCLSEPLKLPGPHMSQPRPLVAPNGLRGFAHLVERLRRQRGSFSPAVPEAHVPSQSAVDIGLERGSRSIVTVDVSTDGGRSKPFHG
jgi:hypothetical protein